ncbi:MAG TPA: polyphosphate kinase 2 family protein [Phycicoccus elongatus]|jgi:PPK2 family polyphosphate:nucleotide phosphotransferase|uniref:Putative polyphosphate kinase (Could be polyphosphate AMP phosphotransferase (Pap)) n=1 Tax=Phycicoccus elongatus Lp2 TaxID=1193181 RepID=N0E572_9MICO|nr:MULTISPECIES: polyphosphate kinase 2 family protein [Phycicoccus]MCA0322493.1 polyphosphate kinase 2 family protein [Actinomycetota bacterium]MCB1240387.1 polyphosphate kinase 2 family protein [Tetrasphaera sp.]MCB9405642.1 polyphosphate kinase 2 family protein [Tetrasphaera sp.]MCO5301608.1 polyphosphate kinase 2 family protein [Phycicoccus sp.]CCH71145.1 Putative polyphosphate kinase (could be polyphosphate AMP phosphotransferase (pap)) [Phycicoccus elongatus Lp2]
MAKTKDKGKKSAKDKTLDKTAKSAKAKAEKKGKEAAATNWTQTLRVAPGFSLLDLDAESTPGFAGDKAAGQLALEGIDEQLSELQERLYAESKGDRKRSLLLVVQGMDTSGKGGIMRYVVGAFDPQGVKHTAFKAPTKEERAHPFLWRITNALPLPGEIGVFDRSQYEDVLIVRVHDLVPRTQWSRRYAQINAWEKKVADSGTTIVKIMLHISSDEQKARLGERLDRPDKYWKFNPGDLDERAYWADYMQAYQAAFDKCSTDVAPWFVVPANRKWYARLAVANLVLEHLKAMDPQWPPADFDVEEQKARLAAMP